MNSYFDDSFLGSNDYLKPDDGSDPSEDLPYGPSQEKKDCKASGGVWVGTGPNGEGYCQSNAQPNKDCGVGYEWEADPTGNNPNGRCKVTGTSWEDGCFIDPGDGKTYCKNNPKPSSNDQTQTPVAKVNTSGGGVKSPGLDNSGDLFSKYNALFNGGADVPNPYDAAAIARLEGKLKANAESSKSANRRQYLASRSAMQLGTTGRTAQGLRNINDAADARVDQGAIDINDTAIRANFDNAVANINRKVSILNSQAQFAIAMAQDANQRQSIQNSYSIQLMQLQNQMEMLKLQLTAQLAG